jgi:hypothetical protein
MNPYLTHGYSSGGLTNEEPPRPARINFGSIYGGVYAEREEVAKRNWDWSVLSK